MKTLTPQDQLFINGSIRKFKVALFQLVSDFGPDHVANFIISYDEIKSASGRVRLSDAVLSGYRDMLSNHGFTVNGTGSSLHLSASARQIVLSGNESVELAAAINLFRTRAAMHGNVDDM